MADDLDELTRGVRRMWSTASLTSKLGAKAAGRMLFRKKPAAADLDVEAATRIATTSSRCPSTRHPSPREHYCSDAALATRSSRR